MHFCTSIDFYPLSSSNPSKYQWLTLGEDVEDSDVGVVIEDVDVAVPVAEVAKTRRRNGGFNYS